jgi:hypothetical protein
MNAQATDQTSKGTVTCSKAIKREYIRHVYDGALRMQRWGGRGGGEGSSSQLQLLVQKRELCLINLHPTRTHSVVISRVNMLGKYLHPFESKNNSQATVNDNYLHVGALDFYL